MFNLLNVSDRLSCFSNSGQCLQKKLRIFESFYAFVVVNLTFFCNIPGLTNGSNKHTEKPDLGDPEKDFNQILPNFWIPINALNFS